MPSSIRSSIAVSTSGPRLLRRSRGRALTLAAALLVAGCTSGDAREAGARDAAGDVAAAAAPTTAVACASDNVGLTLPTGFCASLFADSLGGPRHAIVRSNGDVYVMRLSAPRGTSGAAGVVVLRDSTGDGRADARAEFGPLGGTGLRFDGENLYVDAKRAILRYRVPVNAMRPVGEPDTIVSGLPTGGHEARNFVLDGRGGLIVNIGSQTNACQVADRQAASPGHDPCTELETRAGLWRFDANRTGQRFSAQQRWATGIRNSVALERAPNGQIWVAQHGRDNLTQNWPEHFNAEQGAENPAEELIQVSQGDDFGWPYCFYSNQYERLVQAPEYGGDGQRVGRCSSAKGPVVAFPGHWAPMSLLFYTGSQLPARYRDGVFIAFHGSWNRAPLPQAGFNVIFQPLRDGRAAGKYELFADGFAGGTVQGRGGAEHRPVGLAQAADGSLLVTDDRGGRIYRISFTGRR